MILIIMFCFYSSRRDFDLRQLRLRGFFIRKNKSHFGFFFFFRTKKNVSLDFMLFVFLQLRQ